MENFVNNSEGKLVPASQGYNTDPKQSHQIILTPSDSPANFNAFFTLTFRTKNIYPQHMILEFNTTNVTGITGGTGVSLVPSGLWFSRIDILVNGVTLDSYYPEISGFIFNQLYNQDETRKLINMSMGDYSNLASRQSMASTNGQSYFLDLWGFWKTCHIPILPGSSDIQFRIYMKDLPSIVELNGGSGSPACSINYCQLNTRATVMTESESASLSSQLVARPFSYNFSETRQMSYSVNGTNSVKIVLSGITGKISDLIFYLRTSTTGSGLYTFTPVLNFDILNSSSSSLTGGVFITSARNKLLSGRFNSSSSWLSEGGANPLTANSNNVYVYSFALSPVISATTSPGSFGYYTMSGNEQLVINFLSSFTGTIDIFGFNKVYLQVDKTGFSKQ